MENGSGKRIVNLFTKGSHHRNLSVSYIVQNLFHQGKGNLSISLNSHYLVLFKNPRDRLQILTLAKQMYPAQTAWFMEQYDDAVQRPFGYLFVDLKLTTHDSCRSRTNVLPGVEDKVSQELLQYLKQQKLMVSPFIPEMQRLQNNMDNLLYRADLGDYDKARRYMQLRNRVLTYKHQLNSLPETAMHGQPQQQNQTSSDGLAGNLPTAPTPVQDPLVTIPATPVQTPNVESAAKVADPQVLPTTATSTLPTSLPPTPLTVELSSPKMRKRPQIPKGPFKRSRRIHRSSPYKYSKTQEEHY